MPQSLAANPLLGQNSSPVSTRSRQFAPESTLPSTNTSAGNKKSAAPSSATLDKADKSTSKKKVQEIIKEGDQSPLLVPQPIDEKVFSKLTSDQKMGNIVSILNLLCKKQEDLNISLKPQHRWD